MASHGDKEESCADDTLFSNNDIPAPRSSSDSISIFSSNLSHEPGPTNPARSPAPAQRAQLAASTSTTQSWPAWGGSDEASLTNEHQVAIVSPNPAAPNPQNQEPEDPTNPTAAPNPTAPARGTDSPRDKCHGTSGDTAAAESSSTTLITPGMTATATLPRPEEPHERASVDSVVEAATVADDGFQTSETDQASTNVGEGGSTSHSNQQPSSYDWDANTLAGSTIEVESVRIIISRRPGCILRSLIPSVKDTDVNNDGDSAYGSDA